MRQPLFHKLDQLSTDRWARRGVRMLLRAAWLSVCIWCIALGGHMLWGWPLRVNVIGALALAIVGGAVVLLLRPRLGPRAAADRRRGGAAATATAGGARGCASARSTLSSG